MINEYYNESIGGSKEKFIEFVKVNNPNVTEDDAKEIDFLLQRIAQNMFVYKDNISTAKSDFISLCGILEKNKIALKM